MPDWIPLVIIGVFAAYAAAVTARETVKARRARRDRQQIRAEYAAIRAEEIRYQREQRASGHDRQQERKTDGRA